ncbi:ABC transporter substrate-binding protein [Reinekea marinisedimentorum]|uniref:Putative thiamine transport system substrate-binding protein n=1 Tax=Reinekea marinisedimentorum TaxID=230495 RepID=A0A4R3HZ99_9GAMM|nr:ABC transporter substrate-binding protein [Reinekea marinisedimentorum]TCS38204.1 putative thiamine transport system substrate-binding protein [Reinekea marinisedimentorum]
MRVLIHLIGCLAMTAAATASAENWQSTVTEAKGQTVYFHAWGGDENINDYIQWAADEVKDQYNITVRHVKNVAPNAVSQVLAEKAAGKNSGGAVDLIWINGENFANMKEAGLLYGSFTQDLPNYQFVDTENKPTTLYDFTVPVDNLEAPWGMAQLVFMYDSEMVANHPNNASELLSFAQSNPGRFTYPAPPAFHGTTFIKQILLELGNGNEALFSPVDQADFAAVTAPLWRYLDQLHPAMWQQGKTFTDGAPRMKQLLNDGEIFISLSFNPFEASSAIANGELPDTIRTYIHEAGTIGNTHFVTIPFNASHPEAAMVFANFLMSPQAQARKANADIWGDPTVLSMTKLNSSDRAVFNALPKGIATLSNEELANVLREPHASWVEALEAAWLQRYGN